MQPMPAFDDAVAELALVEDRARAARGAATAIVQAGGVEREQHGSAESWWTLRFRRGSSG
jgi:hypothetical protein